MAISPIIAQRHDFASDGEYDIFLLFNQLFANDTSVCILANVNYVQANRKLNGQVDFIYIDNQVVLFIEVKGGSIYFDKDQRKFFKSYTNSEEKDPFKQVTDYLYDFRDKKIKRRFSNLYLDQKIALGYCVLLPQTLKPQHFKKFQKGEGIWTIEYDPEVTGDLNDVLSLDTFSKFLERVKRYWLKHPHNKHHNGINSDEFKMLSTYIRDDLKFEIPLPKYFEISDEETKFYTRKQAEVILKLVSFNEGFGFAVMGGPGTGKTLIARELLVKLRGQGKKVLFVCQNKSLADFLRSDIRNENASLLDDANVVHLDKLFQDILIENNIPCDVKKLDTWNELPSALLSNRTLLNIDSYDYVIVDEGQDIFYEAKMLAIELFLKGGFESYNFSVFLDKDAQNTYGTFDEDYFRLFKKKFHVIVQPLSENCRNTQGIVRTSTLYTGISEGSCMKKANTIFKPVFWNSEDELINLIQNTVNDLDSKNVPLRMISILCEEDMVEKIKCIDTYKFSIWQYDKDFKFEKNRIMVLSTQHFKGLENNIIIFTGTKEFDSNSQIHKAIWHVAFTRAKDLLYLFLPSSIKSQLTESYFKNAKPLIV